MHRLKATGVFSAVWHDDKLLSELFIIQRRSRYGDEPMKFWLLTSAATTVTVLVVGVKL
jgi:hypothetical protein